MQVDRHVLNELVRYLRTVVNGLDERNDPTDSDGRNFYCAFSMMMCVM